MTLWYPLTGRVVRRLSGDVRRAKTVGLYAHPELGERVAPERVEAARRTEAEAVERGARLAADPAGQLAELAARRVERRDLVARYPKSDNNSVEPLLDGPQAFSAIFDDIRKETSSIHIVQFGFQAPEMAQLLVAKAGEGVDVRLVLDAKGSKAYGECKRLFERMAEAGIQITTNDGLALFDRDGIVGQRRRVSLAKLNELGHWDHRKIYLLGGASAYVGGMGNEAHFLNGKQHDLMYRVTGDAVRHMQCAALASFMFLAGRGHVPADARALAKYFPDPPSRPAEARVNERRYFGYPHDRASPLGETFESPVFGGVSLQFVQNVPGEHWLEATETYIHLCRTAKTSLDVMTPYFGDDRLESEIVHAVERTRGNRGRVRVFVPSRNETPMCDATQRQAYRKLQAAGADVIEYSTKSKRDPPEGSGKPNMLHAKLVLADGVHGSVGTCNHDGMSLYQLFEGNVNFDDQRLGAYLTEMLDADEANHSFDAVPPTGLKNLTTTVINLYERLWQGRWDDPLESVREGGRK